MKLIKRTIAKLFQADAHGSKQKKKMEVNNIAAELSNDEIEMIQYVTGHNLTMTSLQRLVATLKSCKYVVENDVDGDFVECGVWRGGNGILAKKVFESLGSDKNVYMFDTYLGMTEPTDFDVSERTMEKANQQYLKSQKSSHNEWCYASLQDVQENCSKAGIDMSGLFFVKGDVCQTLQDSRNIPRQISVLRLDTDWYESTQKELEVLYPILSNKGVLIIDDYGHWQGARKAVDEYFEHAEYKPLFNVTDYTGRAAVKIEC